MSEIEQKALALVNEVSAESDVAPYWGLPDNEITRALCRAIEKHEADKAAHAATVEGILNSHEAFRQKVSDAVEDLLSGSVFYQAADARLRRFIITKPVDPLAFALADCEGVTKPGPGYDHDAKVLREALAKRGLKIVEDV